MDGSDICWWCGRTTGRICSLIGSGFFCMYWEVSNVLFGLEILGSLGNACEPLYLNDDIHHFCFYRISTYDIFMVYCYSIHLHGELKINSTVYMYLTNYMRLIDNVHLTSICSRPHRSSDSMTICRLSFSENSTADAAPGPSPPNRLLCSLLRHTRLGA